MIKVGGNFFSVSGELIGATSGLLGSVPAR
jgi:hypothetical protein